MSRKHPVIAVTGSSGAGTSTVEEAFGHIFHTENITPCLIQGDSFHRYDRLGMHEKAKQAEQNGKNLSHFGVNENLLTELSTLFKQYGQDGTGLRRYYIHNKKKAQAYQQNVGTFTPWEEIPANTDLLFYEGLHGGVIHKEIKEINVAEQVDLLIGVVPIVNLEWIQKIHRDTFARGYRPKDVTDIILRRMYDYVHYIAPQFSNTDINFQRVPTVDTSNPFTARDIPTADESLAVIRFRDPAKFNIDFPYLLSMIRDSFMSRKNTIVVPGGKMMLAMEIILLPIIGRMMSQRFESSLDAQG